jgi:hypothetical protein
MTKSTLVDVVDGLNVRLKQIAYAISSDAAPGHDAAGGTVNSLTEAVMGITDAGMAIASALDGIANAIRELSEGN